MRRAAVLLLLLALSGCDTGSLRGRAPAPVALPSPAPFGPVLIDPTAVPAPPSQAVRTPAPTRARTTAPAPAPATASADGGWEITVYYTAVERFHDGEPRRVTGCPRLDCTGGTADLGTYPADFVRAVEDEGTGLTASGRYLNWSYDTGYWLDTAARDSFGGVLVPFASAAADPGVLRRGSAFRVTGCGRQDDGSPPAARVCAALRRADWVVRDEFTPGLGGPKHLDVYLGPETGPGFTESEWFVTVTGATLAIR